MTKQEMVAYLLKYLIDETPQFDNLEIPKDLFEQEKVLHALFNTRPPMSVSANFLDMQNQYLQLKKAEKVVVPLSHLIPQEKDSCLYIWQGDITRLGVDAIVNAANKKMLGCFQPLHVCVDNAIHTYAGVQLRLDCYKLLQEQGRDEPFGSAKITPAYNLPAKFILHTVGPIVNGTLTQKDKNLLIESYLSCLVLAEKNRLESIAFCCLSTGIFHFPQKEAAQIAVQTVTKFLKTSRHIKKVVFNVYKDEDSIIYHDLLD